MRTASVFACLLCVGTMAISNTTLAQQSGDGAAPTPAPANELPPVDVIQKKAAPAQTAQKKSAPKKKPAPVAAAPAPVAPIALQPVTAVARSRLE